MMKQLKRKQTQACLPKPGHDPEVDMTVLARLNALKSMGIPDLKTEWVRLFDAPAPNNSGPYLRMRLGHRMQELTYGGLGKPAKRMLELLVDEVEGGTVRKSMISDPRTPVVGTRLIREWDGVEHTITVLKQGFEWQGRQYKSLSAIARTITGTRWNGFRFFGLRSQKRGAK
jgi:hypothetical protein